MKIVVIGGTGLIGSKVVERLKQKGHQAIAAAPNTGVNTITGEGLKEAMAGAQVVIDLANSPSFEDKAVLEFFETSRRNLRVAEAATGVRHHLALSIVGIDRTDNGYFRAKVAQEKLIETSGIPYTIIRSTQFLEFLDGIAAASADGNRVRLSPGLFQPIAADDVAAIVADVAVAAPRNGIIEIAGPERAPFNEIVARYLKSIGEPREVVRDPEARYFGSRVEEHSLVPLGEARLGRFRRMAPPPLTGSSLIRGSANRRRRLHEAHPLFAACRHPAVRQCPRGCTEVEERQGDPRLPARAAERSRQEHQGRARRIQPGPLFARAHACQIRLHLRDRARGGDPQSGQRRTGDHLPGRTELLRAARRPPRRQCQCQQDKAG